MKRASFVGRWLIVLSLIVAAVCLATPSLAGDNNPGVFPVDSRPYGLTYGEWSARHWEWLYSLPVNANPIFDTADVSAGQSGQVWFLGGTFAEQNENGEIVGRVTRNVTIPPGKALFFPLIDAECSTIEGNGDNEAELRSCAEFDVSFVVPSSLFCVIDGRSVNDLSGFAVESPLFTFGPLPDNNVLEDFGVNAPAGSTSPSVSAGYFVMLMPRSVGNHTLHFGGKVDLTPIGGPIFVQDITYNITVAPR
jgi:hypothetical protein